MFDDLRSQYMELAKTLAETNVKESPNFLTAKALYKALLNQPCTYNEAADIVASIKIDVSESFVQDKELFDTVIQGTARMLRKMKYAYDEIDPLIFPALVRRQDLSITYKA
jgi:hypothetical protein